MTDEANNETTQRRSDGRRVVLGFGSTFWEGPAGWLLVLLVVAAGIAAITFVYKSGDEGGQADLVVDIDDVMVNSLPGAIITGMELRVLDGMPAGDDEDFFAVMIDNIHVARPAAGIADAPLVIEALAEGNITRLMAFFTDDMDLRRIGPVRSARPYFIDWAAEYGAVYIHVGGSPDALDLLAASSVRNLNQFFWGGYFWRDRDRYAPHNVITSTDLLHEALEEFNVVATEVDNTRPFKGGGPDSIIIEGTSAEEIRIDYSTPTYRVVWSYDKETNRYARYQGRGEFTDETDRQVLADNIIVQITDMEVVDRVGRREVRTVGEGDAIVFRDGQAIEAKWLKENGGRTKYIYTYISDEIPLNVGTTWIEVVGDEEMVEYESEKVREQ
ncbi:MAG: DUF3048 domain-containing protein [Patescibacteria group bacterium]|nr:DUF3048 domain-containing protein [Patescibacteria group bacterium]